MKNSALFAIGCLAVGMHCRGSIGRIYGHYWGSLGIVCVVLLFWWRQRGNDGSSERGRWIIAWELIEYLLPILAGDSLELVFMRVEVGVFVAED